MMRKSLAILVATLLIALASVGVMAEEGIVLGLKRGAAAGQIGLELEYEFPNGLAIGILGGAFATADQYTFEVIAGVSAAATARYYIRTDGSIRPFVGGFGGVLAVSDGSVTGTAPLLGATGGAELRLGSFRITGELGYLGAIIGSEGILGGFTLGYGLGYVF